MRHVVGTTLIVVLICIPLNGQDSIITTNLSIGVPPRACDIPIVARQVALEFKRPAGIEHLPEGCVQSRGPESLVLTGLSLSAAIKALEELDPRYRWSISGDLIAVRPAAAWDDSEHFLHALLPAFRLDSGHMGNALNAVQSALGPGRYATLYRDFLTAEGNRRFSVILGPTSVFEALNEIARTHRSLIWEVGYCQGRVSRQTAIIRMRTFDGTNISSHAVSGPVASSCLAD